MVRGDPDDGVARNLLPEIEEEAKEESPAPAVESETPAGSPMVDAPSIVIDLTGAERTEPQTAATRAMNAFPPQFPPDWIPARALELLTAKNDVLKCLRVTKVSPSGEVRDPGFALMNDPHQLVAAIIGVFNTGGCSVVAADYERIPRFPVETLRAAGQATYDLFLRHQAWKRITAAAKSSLHGLVDGSDLQKLAEKYMGHSKEEVVEMREEVARQKAMIMSLESYLQDMADQQTRLQKSLDQRNKEVEDLKAKTGRTTDVPAEDLGDRREKSTRKPEEKKPKADAQQKFAFSQKPPFPTPKMSSEQKFSATPVKQEASTTDYLADIYEDCVAQMQGVNATTRLRQAAVADLKSFDGRSRSEHRGKGWLSSLRAAFRRDQMTDGEACLQFPVLLTDKAMFWYRQLDRATRSSWPALQKAFELEYCGVSVTAQQKYYEIRRKQSEEPLDYLYRLNVQAMEAQIDYAQPETGRLHVRHFINTCEDVDLARQLGGLRLSSEEELRDVLKGLLRQRQRLKTEDEPKGRFFKRDTKESKQGVRAKTPVFPLQATPQQPEKTAPEDDAEDASESDLSSVASSEDEDEESGPPKVSSDALGLVNLFTQVLAVSQGKETKFTTNKTREEPPTSKPRQETRCTHCGSQRHQDRDCWRRLTCGVCGRQGHPSEHCYQLCKGCGKLHDKGACQLEEIANGLRSWYDPSKHAGLLPQKVEQWLN